MLLPSKENSSAKADYKFYATLLDAFQWYLDSDEDDALQEFIDKVNRVPFTSEAAEKGTAFNELVDRIKNGELAIGKELEVKVSRGSQVVSYSGFDFKVSIVEKFVSLFQNARDQVYIEAILPTSKGNVLLYGYIDEVLPAGLMSDIKCTGSYDFPKFLKNFQHKVYPYCMLANDIDADQFRYDITDYNNHYQETYTFDVIRDTKVLVKHCERLIDFLQSQRDKITDKKCSPSMELNNPRWYQLRHNIASYFKPSHAYGMKGDHVMLIAEHGEVWIVEGMDKQRFPVKQSSLLDQDGNPLCSDEGNNMNFSEALATALPAKTKKGRKITKPANSQTLF